MLPRAHFVSFRMPPAHLEGGEAVMLAPIVPATYIHDAIGDDGVAIERRVGPAGNLHCKRQRERQG